MEKFHWRLWGYYSWGVRNHTETLFIWCASSKHGKWRALYSAAGFWAWNLKETDQGELKSNLSSSFGTWMKPHTVTVSSKAFWNVFHNSQWNIETFIFKWLQNWRWKLVVGSPWSVAVLISASSGHCAESPCPFLLLFPKDSKGFSFLCSKYSNGLSKE